MNNEDYMYTEDGQLIVNYELNEDKTFKAFWYKPVDPNLPNTLAISDRKDITVGVTKLINGEIVQPEPEEPPTMTDEQLIEAATIRFRHHRDYVFKNGFDIWEKAVLRGREEDSEDIMAWYQDMLDFTELITKNTTKDDYPEVPQKIKYYLGVE